jgi:stress response protein YsnF
MNYTTKIAIFFLGVTSALPFVDWVDEAKNNVTEANQLKIDQDKLNATIQAQTKELMKDKAEMQVAVNFGKLTADQNRAMQVDFNKDRLALEKNLDKANDLTQKARILAG